MRDVVGLNIDAKGVGEHVVMLRQSRKIFHFTVTLVRFALRSGRGCGPRQYHDKETHRAPPCESVFAAILVSVCPAAGRGHRPRCTHVRCRGQLGQPARGAQHAVWRASLSDGTLRTCGATNVTSSVMALPSWGKLRARRETQEEGGLHQTCQHEACN